jgi:hypothetical protein
MSLTLHITWKFPPEQVSAFYDALRPLQEKLIQEKECLYFNVYEVGQDTGVVRLVEIWDCDMKWMVNVRLNFCLVPFSVFLINLDYRVGAIEEGILSAFLRGREGDCSGTAESRDVEGRGWIPVYEILIDKTKEGSESSTDHHYF